jgi:putative spermidine/putrescine transport system substrate-binding protein
MRPSTRARAVPLPCPEWLRDKEANMAKADPVSRRTVLRGAASVVLGGPLVLVSRKSTAQAKRIVIRDPGGPFTVAFAEAYYKLFREATGIEAVGVASAHEPTSQIKSMVETKTYTWDMALLSQAASDQLVKDGDYLEKIGLDHLPGVQEIRPEFRDAYNYGNDVYTAVLGYRTDAFRGKKAPATWKDLWDVAGFPGRRSIRKHPFDTIEEALLADGVPKDTLYPCDIDRAFKSLDRIKKHVAVWWTGGAQATQMIKTGEVDIVPTWNARLQAAIDEGAPAAISWEQGLWAVEGWSILKGTPHADVCRKFIEFCADAKRQAAYTAHLSYGPTNPNAYKFVDPKRAPMLPTHPDNYARSIRVDYKYWGSNKDKVTERFNAWLIS